MKPMEQWDVYISDSMCDEMLESMTTEERQFLDKLSRNSTSYPSLGLMERALARDFFVKGYLGAHVKYVPKEEQDKITAKWRAEDEAKRQK
jgi:hypothetical protein